MRNKKEVPFYLALARGTFYDCFLELLHYIGNSQLSPVHLLHCQFTFLAYSLAVKLSAVPCSILYTKVGSYLDSDLCLSDSAGNF